MKKLIVFLLGAILILTGCSSDDYKFTSERLNAGIFDKSYAEIVRSDDNVVINLYCVFTSGTYTPKIKDIKKDNEVLTFIVKQYTKSNVVTCDMAYWKLVINVDLNYVLGIDEVKVFIN